MTVGPDRNMSFDNELLIYVNVTKLVVTCTYKLKDFNNKSQCSDGLRHFKMWDLYID